MNMKFIAGISLATIAAAGFWACGEGNINEMTSDDGVFGLRNPEEWEGLKDQALESCRKDDACKLMYGDYLADPNAEPTEDTPSSSDNQGSQNGTPTSSSARGGDINIVDKPESSSSPTVIDNPDNPTPSSSSVEIVTGLGSCKPVSDPNPINKGQSTQWQFIANPAMYATGAKYTQMDFITKASYDWTFSGEGVTPATGTGAKTAAITYANSGKFGASVVVTMPDGASETIACSAQLQVNGAAISGCKCATTVTGAVDYLETPTVSWSVTGCTSTGATVNSYTWDGVAGTEATFTHTFTAAAASYAPTLKVGNDDNTEIAVECPAVKVTEGPEYTIDDDNTSVEFKAAGSYAVVVKGNPTQQCRMSCEAQQAVEFTINDVEFKGQYYIPLGNNSVVDNSWCSSTLAVVTNGPLKCSAQWN